MPAHDVRAIASRSEASAKKAAAALGIPKAYGSYEALLADPEIEAVYNPLPNHLHVPLTLQARQAGKHVLCEKPIAINAEEAASCAPRPARPTSMEAFMVRFHPQWLRARELIRSGAIGDAARRAGLLLVLQRRPGQRPQPGRHRRRRALRHRLLRHRRGPLRLRGRAARAVALVDRDPQFRTDRTTSAIVDFGAGRQLTSPSPPSAPRTSASSSAAPRGGSRS